MTCEAALTKLLFLGNETEAEQIKAKFLELIRERCSNYFIPSLYFFIFHAKMNESWKTNPTFCPAIIFIFQDY